MRASLDSLVIINEIDDPIFDPFFILSSFIGIIEQIVFPLFTGLLARSAEARIGLKQTAISGILYELFEKLGHIEVNYDWCLLFDVLRHQE